MSNYNTVTAAPIWKQSMLVLLALFPAVMLETLFLFPHLTFFNPVLAHFFGVVMIVCAISWALMPLTLYLLGWWLNPNTARQHYSGFFIILSLYLIEICFFLLIS